MPGLNWCQLINFWCHLINIWGHVLLTISDCLTAKLTGRATTECFDVVKNARTCDLDTSGTGSNIGFQSMIFNLWCTGTNHIGNICLNQLLKMQKVVNFLSCLRIYSWHRLSNGIFGKSWDFVKDTKSSLQSPLSKKQTKLHSFPLLYKHIFPLTSRKYAIVLNW